MGVSFRIETIEDHEKCKLIVENTPDEPVTITVVNDAERLSAQLSAEECTEIAIFLLNASH